MDETRSIKRGRTPKSCASLSVTTLFCCARDLKGSSRAISVHRGSRSTTGLSGDRTAAHPDWTCAGVVLADPRAPRAGERGLRIRPAWTGYETRDIHHLRSAHLQPWMYVHAH
jgi:hypothetical protein